METLESALRRFQATQIAKFEARSAKQGMRSVTVVGDSVLREPQVRDGLMSHLFAEVRELSEAPFDSSEQIDVANMAFLLWWHDNPIQEARDGR